MAKEPERGEKTATRKQKAAAPTPQEPPAATPEQIAQEAAAATQEAAAAAAPAPALPNVEQAQQPQKPNMWRLPQDYSEITGQLRKPTLQRNEDIGLFWQVMAVNPNVPWIVRRIAEGYSGGGRKPRG